ncbi:MAG: class I SAM-dependent RNA methyltransferase [Deltaproteobacteria bacterium]|nr:MAG: class I SAM-dependent RNA methyltransferase [Deltaproteobacteria bacterium]
MLMEPRECSHRPPCPGCPAWGEVGIAPEAEEKLLGLMELAGLESLLPVVEGQPYEYRHRARSAVRGRVRSPKMGIFAKGTHQIVDIPRCAVHHPCINEVIRGMKAGIRAVGLQPYIEKSHKGWLRYVQLVVERSSQTVQLVLVGNTAEPDLFEPLAQHLWNAGLPLHSVWWNGNPERTNTIFGPLWHRFFGPEMVVETIGGASVFFPPGAFGQSNLNLADFMVAQVTEWIPPTSRVAEFYAGVGAFGLGLLRRGATVLFNEVSPAGIHGLRVGLEQQEPDAQERASVHVGPAGDHANLVQDCDVVLVDPPRKGLDEALLQELIQHPPETFVYVSCGLDAFVREAQQILESGSMQLVELIAVALFPHTEHVETMARFVRRTAS